MENKRNKIKKRLTVLAPAVIASVLFSVLIFIISFGMVYGAQKENTAEYAGLLAQKVQACYPDEPAGKVLSGFRTNDPVFLTDSEGNVIFYMDRTSILNGMYSLQDIGINDDIYSKSGSCIRFNGGRYLIMVEPVTASNGEEFTLGVLSRYGEYYTFPCISGVILVFFIVAVLTAAYAVYLRADSGNEGRSKSEVKAHFARKATVFAVIATLLSALLMYFTTELFCMSSMKDYYDEKVEPAMLSSLDSNLRDNDKYRREAEADILSEAREIALSFDRSSLDGAKVTYRKVEGDITRDITGSDGNPETCFEASPYLKNLAEDNGVDAIRLFDSDGYCIATTEDDWNCFLDDDEASPAYFFRKVLDRKEKAGTCEFAGRDGRILAAAYPVELEDGCYGLITAFKSAENLYLTDAELVSAVMSVIEKNTDLFAAVIRDDAEHTLYYASPDMHVSEDGLELPEEAFQNRFIGYTDVDGIDCLVFCNRITGRRVLDGDSFFFAATFMPQSVNYLSGTSFYIFTVVLELIFLMIIIVAVSKMRVTYIKAFDISAGSDSQDIFAEAVPTPEQRIVKFVGALLTVIMWLFILYIIAERFLVPTSLGYHLRNYSWNRGVNILSVLAIISLWFIVSAFVMILKKAEQIIQDQISENAQTVFKLIISAVNYASILFCIFYGLYLLGLNTKEVLTSLGAFSLIVGLGAQKLIGDIIAGFFIMVEGHFKIGDIVETGGFTGKVVSVGLKSCTIEGKDGTVKVINNSALENLVNFSCRDRIVKAELQVDLAYPWEKIAGIMDRELPAVQEKYADVCSDITYEGITKQTNGNSVTVRLTARCKESNRGRVSRVLLAELLKIGQENGFVRTK